MHLVWFKCDACITQLCQPLTNTFHNWLMKHFQVGSGKTICQPASVFPTRSDPFTGAHSLSFAAPQRTPERGMVGAFSAIYEIAKVSHAAVMYHLIERNVYMHWLIISVSRRRVCVEKLITPRHAALSVSKLSVWCGCRRAPLWQWDWKVRS